MSSEKKFTPRSRRRFLQQAVRLAVGVPLGSTLGSSLGVSTKVVGQGSGQGISDAKPYILTLFCPGGWDSAMVFDPKVGVSTVAQEDGASRATSPFGHSYVHHASRPAVANFFERFGGQTAIVNGLYTLSLNHIQATKRVLGTSHADGRYLDWMTYYAAYIAPFVPAPHLLVNAPYLPGNLGRYAVPLTTASLQDYLDDPSTTQLGEEGEKLLNSYVQQSFGQLADRIRSSNLDSEKTDALYQNALRDPVLQRVLQAANTRIGDVRGAGFVANSQIALELFRSNRCRAATIQVGNRQNWDTHRDHFARHSLTVESFFTGLTAILDYAETIGIGSNLIVVAVSEMGRAPMLNAAGGKDHWPYTSALLWGRGIAGGKHVGHTDDYLRGQPINPVFGTPGETLITMHNVLAALYLKWNVPYHIILGEDIEPLASILV